MHRGTTFESMSMFCTPFTIMIKIDQEGDDQHNNYINNTKRKPHEHHNCDQSRIDH
jgi:hypothetical protein